MAILIFISTILAGCSGKSLSNESNGYLTSTKDVFVSVAEPSEPFQFAMPFDTETYWQFYNNTDEITNVGDVSGAIVPHHLVGGRITANLFKYLAKQKPPLVIIFGPDHYNPNNSQIISTKRDWQTPFGPIKTDDRLINILEDKKVLEINEEIIRDEHSVSSLVSFVRLALPETQLAVFIAPFFTTTNTIENFISELEISIPDSAVIIASVDFSHYQNSAVAKYHDELSIQTVKNFDYKRLAYLDIDSPAGLYFLLRMMEKRNTQSIAYEIADNSASILQNNSLEEITSYYSAYFVKGNIKKNRIASILNFGDMMLDRNVKKLIDINGSDYIFEKLAGKENRFFRGVDIIGANLEGPFAEYRRTTTKEIAFRFDPSLLSTLTKYNFSIFSQANNHSLDMGSTAFEESKNYLKQAGIDYYGSQYRVDSESVKIREVDGFKIAFIGLNDTNSPVDINKIKELIKNTQSKTDFIIINTHWGEEYKEISNLRQRTLAREMIDAGADVIIGHHPHVVQEMEIYKNRLIFYSLGNFVFDQYFSTPTQESLAVGLIFRENEISAYIFPLEQTLSQVYQMPHNKRIKYLDEWLFKSKLNNAHFKDDKILITR